MKRLILGLVLALFPGVAMAQNTVLQAGPATSGHPPMWIQNGVVQDAGPASGAIAAGQGISELLLTARGTGNAPFVAQGTGQFGSNHCEYDGPVTAAAGYHYLCFSANASTGGGLIAFGAGGGAATLPFNLYVNGANVPLTNSPIAANTVLGNSTSGSLLPSAIAVPGCSSSTSALIWTTNTGFGCNPSIAAASVAASALTGTTMASNVVTSSLTTVGTLASPTLTTPVINGIPTGSGVATANTVSTLVLRDSSGNFSAGTITANLSGNVTGTLTGNITGTAPAGSLTGATLAAGVTGSSLTGLGTITSGVWNGTPVTVPFGGTGATTFTANVPLIGNGTGTVAQGTRTGSTTAFATASGTLTNGHCVSIDASGNFVDAGGACTTSGGGGTVTAGTANQLAYYATSAATVSGLTTANSAVLVTNGSGVPSESTTLPSGLSIGSPTFTGTVAGSNTIPLTILAQIATNTVLVNATSGTANVTAQNVTSCSAAADALIWTTNTGFGCNASVTAAAVPASGITGTILASNVVTSSLTSVGTLTGLTVTGASSLSAHFNSTGVAATFVAVNDGGGGAQAGYSFQDAGTTKWQIYKQTDNTFGMFDSTQAVNFLSVTTGGNVTIGETGGTVALGHVTTGTNADFLCMSASNVILIQSTACTISSMRFKDILGSVSDSQALADVMNLRPVIFTMKLSMGPNGDPNYYHPQIGLTAENVAAVNPEAAVFENDMQTPKSYRQESVIAMLVAAVQAQQTEIERLQRASK